MVDNNPIDETGDLARISGYQREYLDFLDDEEDQGSYAALIQKMVVENQARLIVNINDLRKKNPQRATFLLKNAFEEQIAFQKAIKDYVATIDHTYAKRVEEFHVGFEGTFGANHVTPRTLNSRYLGQLVCVEGIVTKCSLIHPKIVKSVHFCPTTTKFLERKYTDLTSFEAFPASNVYPTKDADGNLLETEYGLSSYKDHQTLSIQEMPEKAPAGQLPRGLDVILDDDLVDKCKPGDRIQLVGSYRCLPSKKGAYTTCTFRTILVACNVILLSKEHSEDVSSEDVVNCKKIARSKQYGNVFNLLAKSIAPSIHGHEYAKKAILCMLLGGNEKVLPNGTRLRGDINVLIIGDPGVAKSQLLRYVLWAAPRAVAATGRASTAVGLTAAVTHDQETGERRLEAGAMVLADRGIICIDEFDKMTDADRTAIHEVMEQGRVTIAKAGIHARLNARCSVLAAANPVFGRYDQYKTPMDNIGLQDSLLSRFDLIFVMLDNAEKETDGFISDHVVRTHRYRKPGEEEGYVLPMGTTVDLRSTYQPEQPENEDDGEGNIFEKYDALLHGNSRSKNDNILSVSFMRKYLQIAKLLKPKLTDEACQMISEQYVNLRSIEEGHMDGGVARTQPVTTRTLETLIRLSTAHAKARMSAKVQAIDVEMAMELVHYAYFKETLTKEKKRRRDQSGDEDEDNNEQQHPSRRKRTRSTHEETQSQDQQMDAEDITTSVTASAPAEETPMEKGNEQEMGSITDDRLAIFRDVLSKTFMEAHTQTLPISQMEEALQRITPRFEKPEIQAALQKMEDENQIMVAQDNIFLI